VTALAASFAVGVLGALAWIGWHIGQLQARTDELEKRLEPLERKPY